MGQTKWSIVGEGQAEQTARLVVNEAAANHFTAATTAKAWVIHGQRGDNNAITEKSKEPFPETGGSFMRDKIGIETAGL